MSAMREQMLPGELARQPGVEPWMVFWSAIWVGALAAICLALVFGLLGIATGVFVGLPVRGATSWKDLGFGAMALSVLGAFFSFAAGGWITARIAGARRPEVSILHGGIVWLLAVPILLVLATAGSATFFGAWLGGLAGTPPWIPRPTGQVSAEAIAVARYAGITALSSLLISLIGAVIGGWMASGEPMTLTYHRARMHGGLPRSPAI